MGFMLLLMRVIHIVLGVFWAGTMIFNALFLFPAIRDAGPDGAKVAAGLMRRRFLDVMPVVALLTIMSGLWLYWLDSGGFQPAFMRSSMGRMLGLGTVATLVAFALGVAIVRPAMLSAAALSQDPTQLAAAQALRMRAAGYGRVIAVLLAVAAAAMAMARYI
ncbi:MAG: hypothetical protein A2W29_03050 [Gemmatimonadetes bacterium RBG_16_66_8]|nr:MAG: hypothetical protein A2W29_03050 [Gemmatimonadetes bacterium RBG_16_66_8]